MTVEAGPALVTGGTGFLGRHVVRVLGAGDRPVRVLARRPPREPLPAGASFQALDVTVRDDVREAVRRARPGLVVHLAGCASPRAAERDGESAFRTNTLAALLLLEAVAAESPRARVLFASSAHVYGTAEGSLSETTPTAPTGRYGSTKAAAECLATGFGEEAEIDLRLLRFFNLVGPGQSEEYALGSFARQVADAERRGGGTLRVGDLDVRRDFLDVRDAARAVALLAEREVTEDRVFNVGSGRARPVRDLLDLLLAVATVRVVVERDPERVRPGEPREVFADIEKLRRSTGFAPSVPLEESVRDLLDGARGGGG